VSGEDYVLRTAHILAQSEKGWGRSRPIRILPRASELFFTVYLSYLSQVLLKAKVK
jgi:hypothetical protein